MKSIKKYLLLGAATLTLASCSDFLDTVPYDALSPQTTWKTQEDANKFLTGCYDGWEDGALLLYWDCASDFAFNNFPWEGLTGIGNGSLTASDPGWSLYDFGTIRRCNEFLEKVDQCTFSNEQERENMKAQARFIRAYNYFKMNWNYGGVPMISTFSSAEEARIPRQSEADVRKYVDNELDEIVNSNQIANEPAERGRIAKGAVLALRMRSALYYEDWATAKDRAEKIIALGQYDLDPDYREVFKLSGRDSKETILAVQYMANLHENWVIGCMYNNGIGGWSSIVPTQNLINTYEMANGLTIDDELSGYDPVHPFQGRDPRMEMSVLYPGCNYTEKDGSTQIFNTLDATVDGGVNGNYPQSADNASKTALTWAKFLEPITQYGDIWSTSCCPPVFRYAEVLLTYCEASNELNGPSDPKIYEYLDKVRARAGMPAVNRTKYGSKEALRELIHRERAVELAGEGLRRNDLLRWKTPDGKMLAEKVMNGPLVRVVGTVSMDESVDPGLRATINVNADQSAGLIENRVFRASNRYLPFPLSSCENNPELKQNPGY